MGVRVGERNEPDQEINSASHLNLTSLRLAIIKEFHKSCFEVPFFHLLPQTIREGSV